MWSAWHLVAGGTIHTYILYDYALGVILHIGRETKGLAKTNYAI